VSKETKTVYVGLSGGVDSSVSALLLKKAGFNVVGVFIKAWYPKFINCNWREEMRDAMRICAVLNIPFKLCDLEKEYKKFVIDYLIEEYKNGRTPNQDVMCNKYVKFDGFLNFALENRADFVATGHYAQNIFENEKQHMLKAVDDKKDQTYFLWTLTQEKLSKILFPIGHLKKEEVRKLAEKNKLFTAVKKDSQGLCFLGHIDIRDFLSHYVESVPGEVLNLDGKVIGKHFGAVFCTLGQRHDFEIFEKNENRSKYYVVSKDIEKNTITVSDNIETEEIKKEYKLEKVNLINESNNNFDVLYRYNGHFKKAKLEKRNSQYYIVFEEITENIAPGQSLVFYKDEECLGGGTIS